MTFYDDHSTHEVLSVSVDDYEDHFDPGITTPTGWCSLPYYVSSYADLDSNKELTTYCKLHYPEYFI